VLRALRKLVDEGRLVRLGYGVYGRAKVSSLSGWGRRYERYLKEGCNFGEMTRNTGFGSSPRARTVCEAIGLI
jgi:hypothetical protein